VTPPHFTVTQVATQIGFTSGHTAAAIKSGMKLSLKVASVRQHPAVTPLFAALVFRLDTSCIFFLITP
jgi:hypothetical protein